MNRSIGALVLALAVVGCGGSSMLSRADLVKQANAICRDRSSQIASTQKRYAKDFRAFVVAAMPVASKSLENLKALKAPANLKHSYEQFLAGEKAQLERIRAVIEAQRAGRRPGPSESVDQIHRQARITRSLGLEACV